MLQVMRCRVVSGQLEESKSRRRKSQRKQREYRQVRMPKEVYDELIKMGTAGNSISDVVARLIKFYKEHHGSSD
jgi:hypothetical protein